MAYSRDGLLYTVVKPCPRVYNEGLIPSLSWFFAGFAERVIGWILDFNGHFNLKIHGIITWPHVLYSNSKVLYKVL